MADLDNFFAKKDKKKKKKGSRISSAVLAEQLNNDPANAEETPIKPNQNPTAVARPDDSEWIEINDDNLTDGLAGLKIKSLESTRNDESEQIKEPEKYADDSDEGGTEDTQGPWAAVSSSPPKTTYTPSVPGLPGNIVSGGRYIPPSQRNSSSVPAPMRGAREKLNVNSVEQFPDLSLASKQREKVDPTFDTVKCTGRKNQTQHQSRGESMELNNKFKVLES